MKHNKFAKSAMFVSLTARDAFSTRPLQRRYEYQEEVRNYE